MSEVEIRAQQIAFPAICPICSMPATHPATISRQLWIPGVIRQSVSLLAPFCERHCAIYTPSDQAIHRLTLLWFPGVTLSAGILALLTMFALSGFSMSEFDPVFVILTCGAFVVGLVAAIFSMPIIGPVMHYFDPLEAKAVRKAFRITTFNVDLGMHNPVLTRVNFWVDNLTYAEALAQLNGARIIN